MHDRLVDDLTATYRALLALYCDAEGGFAIGKETSRPDDGAGLPTLTKPRTAEGRAVVVRIEDFIAHLAEYSPVAHAALVDLAPKLVDDLWLREHYPRFPDSGEPQAKGPFATKPWAALRVRTRALSAAPARILNDEFAPGKSRSDIVCVILNHPPVEKAKFLFWLWDWDTALRDRWAPRAAAAPKVAVIGHAFGSRLREALDDRRVLVIDRDRGDFDEAPEEAVRQKLAWDGGAPQRLAQAQGGPGPGRSEPAGAPPQGPPVDPAYEALPAHVAKSEFDRWLWDLMQGNDSGEPPGSGGSSAP